MAQLDNIQNISFSTAFDIEFVAGSWEGSFALDKAIVTGFNPNTVEVDIAHGLDRRMFGIGLWSVDGDNWQDMNGRIVVGSGFGNIVNVIPVCTDDTLTIFAQNYSGTDYTVQYKVALLHREADE